MKTFIDQYVVQSEPILLTALNSETVRISITRDGQRPAANGSVFDVTRDELLALKKSIDNAIVELDIESGQPTLGESVGTDANGSPA